MTKTYNMQDIYHAVAKQLPKLQEPCSKCAIVDRHTVEVPSEIGYQPCNVCDGIGWLPILNLQNIITNIEYNFTLVLQHDMIGWMADITLDNVSTDCHDNERPIYTDPVAAIYAGLYRAIITSSRRLNNIVSKKTLYTNLDASR